MNRLAKYLMGIGLLMGATYGLLYFLRQRDLLLNTKFNFKGLVPGLDVANGKLTLKIVFEVENRSDVNFSINGGLIKVYLNEKFITEVRPEPALVAKHSTVNVPFVVTDAMALRELKQSGPKSLKFIGSISFASAKILFNDFPIDIEYNL